MKREIKIPKIPSTHQYLLPNNIPININTEDNELYEFSSDGGQTFPFTIFDKDTEFLLQSGSSDRLIL